MSVSRFLFAVSLVTLVSLLYVHQQAEIVRFAYLGQKHSQSFEDLLDKNKILRYNIAKNASLVHIGDMIRSAEFQMPDNYRLFKVGPEMDISARESARPIAKQNIFSRFFSIKRQAEAQVINP